MRARSVRLLAAGLAGAVVALLFGVGAAFAHVTVNPREATQGGYTKLAFRVPNEKDNASTVKLEVNLPRDAPIASVSVRPVQGWTVNVEKAQLATPIKSDDGDITEATSKITWTAANGDAAIKPGQFQEFEISAGPLPEVDQIVFKALQTYSDNEVVRWIDEPTPGQEPEHPAPVLKLIKASAPAATAAASASSRAVSLAGQNSSDRDDSTAVGLGLVGLIAGLLALVIAVLAWRRTRRPA
jgi:periplasmic copper chaperone A